MGPSGPSISPMITFTSEFLSRSIPIDQIQSLSDEELQGFHEELKLVITSIDEALSKASVKQQASGVPFSSTWMNRITTKKRIALKFAAEVNSAKNGGSAQDQLSQYNKIFKVKFREILSKEFSEEELREIELEAVNAARKEYDAWITKTGQRLWYIP